MSLIRFNVFGRILAVTRDGGSWRVYLVGIDGKLGQTGIARPAFTGESELARYLSDVFHESTRPGMDNVKMIP